jgi:uncharacterized OB-fold protein
MKKKKPKDKARAKIKARKREEKQHEEKMVLFRCLGCGLEEEIPREVVEDFDANDGGDLSVPPRFNCTDCDKQMEPVYYKSVHGVIYEWKDK